MLKICEKCKGTGKVLVKDEETEKQKRVDCDACNGTGMADVDVALSEEQLKDREARRAVQRAKKAARRPQTEQQLAEAKRIQQLKDANQKRREAGDA